MVGTPVNRFSIVMQYADGGDLLQKITERKNNKVFFRESQVWRALIEMVHGLKAMHDLNLMHRDIKSANIFLYKPQTKQVEKSIDANSNEKGSFLFQAKIGDMNVSKLVKNGMNFTQTGTPYYASPEVWRDEQYGTESDIWSLGCTVV